MEFKDAQTVESIVYDLRSADMPRSSNRALINDLFNGLPPYTEAEASRNAIEVNVNFLEPTRIAHDARAQFYGAFLKPGEYFKLMTDEGPVERRREWAVTVTSAINKPMKRSLPYYECFRSKFASNVLHGIGPAAFRTADAWCPRMLGIEDVLLPGSTELVDIADGNLPYFVLHQTWSAPQLIRMTKSEKRDPGWNMPMVESVLRWVDEETQRATGSRFPDLWAPEKWSERVKSDGSVYAGDSVPKIEVYDFYYLVEDDKAPGWRRRVILDTYSTSRTGLSHRAGEVFQQGSKDFLYNGNNRRFARKISEIVNFQFADLSAVAPFRYHSIRSLGFLLYSVCHLQNRLRCRFTETIFENLLMLFRIDGEEDFKRALNIKIGNRGFVDRQVKFLQNEERWNPNHQLVQLGLQENARLITQHSTAMTPSPVDVPDRREKTATQVMAELQKTTQLVSAALMQAYHYQVFEYREILRRFCNANSTNEDVRSFRNECLRKGVPAEMLDADRWEIQPERVMGAGNKTLEVAIADKLMAWRPLFDAGAQRQILRDATLALTDDADRSNALVPETPHISESVQHGQYAASTLLAGIEVVTPDGVNLTEYIAVLLSAMAQVVQRVLQTQKGVATANEVVGLYKLAAHIGKNIAQLAQSDVEKSRARAFAQQLGQLMNQVKAFAQRLAEQQQAQGGLDPKDVAKIQGMQLQAATKAELARQSHAQRTAGRQLQWEMEQQRDQQEFEQDQQRKNVEVAAQVRRDAAVAAVELARKTAEAMVPAAGAEAEE